MLAKASEPFHRDGWVYEIKYDGYRLMIERDGKDVTLHSRTGLDLTSRFPEVAKSALRLPYGAFTIDSEVVVHDDRGVPSFARLQQRAAVRGDLATRRASIHDPVTCYAFDLLHACGYDVKGLPLTERKALLRTMLPTVGPIRYSEHIEGNGVDAFHAMRRLGLEGIVGKRADSPYLNGRSEHWRKVRANRTGDFVIAGWAPVKNNPDDIGALVLAEYRGDELAYCGRVGSGLGAANRRALQARIARLRPANVCPTTSTTAPTAGSPPNWSARWNTANTPPTATCGSPSSCACATTRRRTSASASTTSRRRTRSNRNRSGKSSSPTATRSFSRRNSGRRATCSTTTKRYRRGCCRTSSTAPWC